MAKFKQLTLPTPPIKERFKGIFRDFGNFLQSLGEYFLVTVFEFPGKLFKALGWLTSIFSGSKSWSIRSLIWSRGRLGRPVVHFGVLSLAAGVFLTGGVFQSNLVIPVPWEPDLVMGATDITPEENLAKTTAPSYRERDAAIEYVVGSGENLSSIGKKFNVSVESLQFANDIPGNPTLKIGQKLIVPPLSGLLVTVASGDTVNGLALKYQVSPQAVVDINYLDEPFTLHVGQKIMVPGGTIPPKPIIIAPVPGQTVPEGTVYTESFAYSYRGGEAQTVGTGNFLWPTSQRYITQYFSYYHQAIDISMDSDIFAADKGTVVRSGWWPNGYGNAVEIDHGNGYSTIYAHMLRLDVSVGQIVDKGQVLGHMGNTGRSFGQHTHFVIMKDGIAINPLQFF